jgi:aryl-alcohol dehydrogenase-like predicted oxidoreductase
MRDLLASNPRRWTALFRRISLAPMTKSSDFAIPPGTIRLGDLEVRRLGFGAMRLPGKDVWGEPEDPARARNVLRRVVELGMNFIDSSWYYGPHVANRLIAETLHPYPRDLVIASKLGGKRTPDKGWAPYSKPDELRQGCEHDLRDLRRDALDVVHLRYIGAPNAAPFLESLETMIDLKKEGKIRHLALSNVNAKQLAQALERTPIVAVQNLYNVGGGAGPLAKMTHAEVEAPEAVLEACEARGIAYLPFFPLAVGALANPHPALAAAAKKYDATPAQIAIAWLLARSPAILPIPGTSSPEHLEENWRARTIALTRDEVASIERAATNGGTEP